MNIGLIHAAFASLEPLRRAITAQYPAWQAHHQLDDGLQRFFNAKDDAAVERRLTELARTAVDTYGADALLATCSAARLESVENAGAAVGRRFVKIDAPMCELAVECTSRIGVVVSFPPTEAITLATLHTVGRRRGRDLFLQTMVRGEALHALNHGDAAHHDAILTEATESLVRGGSKAIVLAQVSMAHLAEPLRQRLGVPVFESLTTSLKALAS